MPTPASPDTVSMVTEERVLRIGERLVGPGRPTYVIAEVSANHGQRIDHTLEIVRAAAQSGADAVKLQTYTPDTITLDVETGPFVIGQDSPWAGRTLHDLYAEAMTPWEWHAEIFEAARREGLHFLSTPFDASAVEFLDGLGVPVYKIASFELVDIGLLRVCRCNGETRHHVDRNGDRRGDRGSGRHRGRGRGCWRGVAALQQHVSGVARRDGSAHDPAHGRDGSSGRSG